MSEMNFEKRIQIIDDAIALKKTDHIPIAVGVETLPYILSDNGAVNRDALYDYEKAAAAQVQFYKELMPDACCGAVLMSGKANSLAGSRMVDWPGRPGTKVADTSPYQILENAYMTDEEYPELLRDFTGFMLRKYIPRAYSNLSGLSTIQFVPSMVIGTSTLEGLYSPEALAAYDTLKEIGKCDGEAAAAAIRLDEKIASLGIPPLMSGFGEAPFDILSDYYRTTVGAMEDMLEIPDQVEAACELFADLQIASWDYFNYVPMSVKRCYFPLHKGMDGFMSPKQFERFYWKPLLKCIHVLVDMGVTPILYGEGKYFSRIDSMEGLPKGKVLVHFESADPVLCKKAFRDTACLSGFVPIYELEFGTRQQVIDVTKKYLDVLYDGSGYIFDTGVTIMNAKRENWEAMIETVRSY